MSGVGVDERYVARIVRDVQTSGEYEKISQGKLATLRRQRALGLISSSV